MDPALTVQRRIWALQILQVALVVTLFRVGVVVTSASVVLQVDTLYNFSNALSSSALRLTVALEHRKLMASNCWVMVWLGG